MRQAKAAGEILAPAKALRQVRGSRPRQFQLSRKWRHATGIIHPPAFILPTFDGACGRLAEGAALDGDPTLMELARLMRGARLTGFTITPSRALREWAVRMTGACWAQLEGFGQPRGKRPLPCPEPTGKLPEPERRLVERVKRLWPLGVVRVRRCDVDTCYRYFFDASPTASARACDTPGHDVQLSRQTPRQRYRRRKSARRSAK
jgi:hypothetical protein